MVTRQVRKLSIVLNRRHFSLSQICKLLLITINIFRRDKPFLNQLLSAVFLRCHRIRLLALPGCRFSTQKPGSRLDPPLACRFSTKLMASNLAWKWHWRPTGHVPPRVVVGRPDSPKNSTIFKNSQKLQNWISQREEQLSYLRPRPIWLGNTSIFPKSARTLELGVFQFDLQTCSDASTTSWALFLGSKGV